MKVHKVFSVFILLHVSGWAVAHVWMTNHQKEVLLVVDTSYAMKPKFTEIQQWIDEHQKLETYVILDDESGMLSHQPFVRCNGETGITSEIAESAINLLNQSRVE